MNAWLLEPTYWNWMLLGVVLMAIEAIVPGFFFLWMGVAALLVGLALTVLPGMGWAWQLMLFAVLSVGSIAAWRLRLRRQATPLTVTLSSGLGPRVPIPPPSRERCTHILVSLGSMYSSCASSTWILAVFVRAC